jgi:hypothetical protein
MTTNLVTGRRAGAAPLDATPARFFYVDDSGAEDTGYVVYSWIECTFSTWHAGLRAWLDLRKSLYEQYQIPPAMELHATKFINGRGTPSVNGGNLNMSKAARRDVAEQALTIIGQCEELRVGTVFRHTTARTKQFTIQKNQTYTALVDHLDARLGAAGEHGMILMDGDGSRAQGYYDAHRNLKLSNRCIIEDPLFVPAHRSQWVQMADLVAWSAYQNLLRHTGKKFAWEWYDTYLGTSDVNGAHWKCDLRHKKLDLPIHVCGAGPR